MIWIKANYLHITTILKYLVKIEDKHPTLSGLFYNEKTHHAKFPSSTAVFLHYVITKDKKKKVNGIIACEKSGAIHIYLDDEPHSYQLDKVISSILNYTDPFSLFGPSENLFAFKNKLYNEKNHTAVNYHLMVLDYTTPLKKITAPNDIILKKSRVIDLVVLKDLEIDYQIEEVITSMEKSNYIDKILDSFKEKIAKGHTYHLEKNKNVLAKASFNSLGFSYDLLGGVFTTKINRKKGLAKYLISQMIIEARNRKHGVILFVKKDNKAAFALYQSLGFKISNNMQIIYS